VRLAVLSACQTGLVDIARIPDEAVGLPAGLLQAGVPTVVGTLWPVEDIATSLLVGRFYREHLGEGEGDAAAALGRARSWMQAATADELGLVEHYLRRYEASGRKYGESYKAMRYYRANPGVIPFAHPYYWAGFACWGG
jgi:CHAT domain-containing protein